MKDIETREDLLLIMEKFYNKLLVDDTIKHFFTETTTVSQHLPEHFETLATFWEQALFLRGGYFKNMIEIHKKVHNQSPFSGEHYKTWLKHLFTTLDEYFSGPKAEQMKTMSQSMATVMQIKFT